MDGIRHKLDVLRAHCDDLGRPYDEIVKATFGRVTDFDLNAARHRLTALSDLGVDPAILDLRDPTEPKVFEYFAEVVEIAAPLGRPWPLPDGT